MAKKLKTEAPIEEKEIVVEDNDIKDKEMVTIEGLGKFGLPKGQTYKVAGALAKILIGKGAAKLK